MNDVATKSVENLSKNSGLGGSFDPDLKIEKKDCKDQNEFLREGYNPDEKIPKNGENLEQEPIKQLKSDYLDDIIGKSDCPETIDKEQSMRDVYNRTTASEVKQKRIDFSLKKMELRNEWEKMHGRSWPRYDQDVMDENGSIIRRKGDRYDAHHVQPLCLGGNNEASNITPLNAAIHFDHRGVHSSNSPFSKLVEKIGE